ncbi:hypothetical protein Tco_0903058 [Tanacetum coccineum]
MGLWYPNDTGFELTTFLDANYVGCLDTRKSTYGGIQFLGYKLVSWMSKKQECTAMSSAEAEYVALSASCAQGNNADMIELTLDIHKQGVSNEGPWDGMEILPESVNLKIALAVEQASMANSNTSVLENSYALSWKLWQGDLGIST